MGSANTLTVDDADTVGKIEGVKYYSSGVRLRGWTSAGSERDYAQVLGTDVSFPKIYGWSLSKGKYFSRSTWPPVRPSPFSDNLSAIDCLVSASIPPARMLSSITRHFA